MSDAPERIWAVYYEDISAQTSEVYAQDREEGFVQKPTEYIRADLCVLKSKLALDGWQPIETAPKDGTSILLYENDKEGVDLGCCGVGVGFWMYQDPWKGPEYWADLYNYENIMEKPTHWMPLPTPPREKEEE